jgi:tetratricopeptide (TPR) repeat protein
MNSIRCNARGFIAAAALAIGSICLPNFCAAAETNHVETTQSQTNRLERWTELTTDATKALRANQLTKAIQLCEEALALSATFGPTNTEYSRAQVLRAQIYLWEKKYDVAEQMFQNAIASCEKAVGTNSVELEHPLASLANFYYFVVPHLDRVAQLFERILHIVEAAPNPEHRDIIMWSRNLGKVYAEMKQYEKAEPYFKRAALICEKEDPEWMPYELLTAADFFRDWGKFDLAEVLARRSLELREKKLATGGVDAQMEVTVSLGNLGLTYLAAHKPEKAEETFRRSLKILGTVVSPTETDLIPHLIGLADALKAEEKLPDAEKLYARAVKIAETNQVTESREFAVALEKYSDALSKLKKPDEAKTQSERAKALRERLDHKRSRGTAG